MTGFLIVIGIFVVLVLFIFSNATDYSCLSCEQAMKELMCLERGRDAISILKENESGNITEEYKTKIFDVIKDDLLYIYGEEDFKNVSHVHNFNTTSSAYMFENMGSVIYIVYMSHLGIATSYKYEIYTNSDKTSAIAARALLVIDRNIREYYDNKYWLCYDMCDNLTGSRTFRIPRELRWNIDVKYITQRPPSKPFNSYNFHPDIHDFYPKK